MLGYFGAVLIGVTLGLIGGGGSIITVPLLVYVMSLNPVTATAYSLFVVGTSSLVGSVKNIRMRQVDFKAVLAFALPALVVVYFTRKFVVPAIPDVFFTLGNFVLTKHLFIMLFFALIMILASISMIRNFNFKEEKDEDRHFNPVIIILQAIALGLVTGIVGAGGGFLIVPALVLLVRVPMKRAVATSLLIIAINSLIGFLGDVQTTVIDWRFLITFTACAVIGIFLGIYLNRFFNGQKLKKGFGWFILVMGIYIISKELFFV